MLSSICSFLTGRLALRHPTLKVLVREDGMVLVKDRGKAPTYHWTSGVTIQHGYKAVSISNRRYLVHRLIAESFIPNPDNKPTVDHINRTTDDNRVSNLRWATCAEQIHNSSIYTQDKHNLGVYGHDDPKEYHRRMQRLRRELLKQDPIKWQAHLEKDKLHARLYRQRKQKGEPLQRLP